MNYDISLIIIILILISILKVFLVFTKLMRMRVVGWMHFQFELFSSLLMLASPHFASLTLPSVQIHHHNLAYKHDDDVKSDDDDERSKESGKGRHLG